MEVFLAYPMRNFLKHLFFLTSATQCFTSTDLNKIYEHNLPLKKQMTLRTTLIFFSLKSPYGGKFLRIWQHMQCLLWRSSPPILGNSFLNCNLLGKPHCLCCHVLNKLIKTALNKKAVKLIFLASQQKQNLESDINIPPHAHTDTYCFIMRLKSCEHLQ